MCKSIEDSVVSGAVSYFTGILLVSSGNPAYIWLGTFIIVVGSMQWIDATIWYRKERGLSVENLGRIAIPIVLSLELLSAYLGYVYYYKKRMIPYEIILGTGILFLVYSFYEHCEEITVGNDGYLNWCGKKGVDENTTIKTIKRIIFILVLFFPFFFYPDIIIKYILLAVSFVLWLHAMQFNSFGSRWCYSFFVADILILAKLFILG